MSAVAHFAAVPAVRAEEAEAGGASEGEGLDQDPRRHIRGPAMLVDAVAAEHVVRKHADLAFSVVAFFVVEACHVVGADGVAVLILALGYKTHELGARRVLHVAGVIAFLAPHLSAPWSRRGQLTAPGVLRARGLLRFSLQDG